MLKHGTTRGGNHDVSEGLSFKTTRGPIRDQDACLGLCGNDGAGHEGGAEDDEDDDAPEDEKESQIALVGASWIQLDYWTGAYVLTQSLVIAACVAHATRAGFKIRLTLGSITAMMKLVGTIGYFRGYATLSYPVAILADNVVSMWAFLVVCFAFMFFFGISFMLLFVNVTNYESDDACGGLDDTSSGLTSTFGQALFTMFSMGQYGCALLRSVPFLARSALQWLTSPRYCPRISWRFWNRRFRRKRLTVAYSIDLCSLHARGHGHRAECIDVSGALAGSPAYSPIRGSLHRVSAMQCNPRRVLRTGHGRHHSCYQSSEGEVDHWLLRHDDDFVSQPHRRRLHLGAPSRRGRKLQAQVQVRPRNRNHISELAGWKPSSYHQRARFCVTAHSTQRE